MRELSLVYGPLRSWLSIAGVIVVIALVAMAVRTSVGSTATCSAPEVAASEIPAPESRTEGTTCAPATVTSRPRPPQAPTSSSTAVVTTTTAIVTIVPTFAPTVLPAIDPDQFGSKRQARPATAPAAIETD